MSTKISWADTLRYNKYIRRFLVWLPFKWEWLTEYLYPDDAMVTFKKIELECQIFDVKAANVQLNNDMCVLRGELEQLQAEKHLLQQLWVTVNISCTPGDCEDAEVLRKYMKACMVKADKYEAFIQSLDKERDDNE